MPEAIIRSEDDLWLVLERLRMNDEPLSDLVLRIDGWNPELLYLPEDEVSYSLRPSTAKAITEFHASLTRAYAYVLHGQPNAKLLSKAEKQAIDIIIAVKPGSNSYEVISEALEKLIEEAVASMSGEQITLVLIILILAFFSQSLARAWFNNRLEENRHKIDADERIGLSEKETERMRIMAGLCEDVLVQPIQRESDRAKTALTRAATTEGRARVLGTDLTGNQAKVVLAQDRKKGAGKRLDGVYDVVKIGTENPGGYVGRLRGGEDKQEFDVEINIEDLTDEDLSTLFEALREKRAAHLHVNAWSVGDKVDRAIVMRAESLDKGSNDED